MKTFLILGAGTAGTLIAHKMAKHLDSRQWKIIMVDKDDDHFYQPGYLFIPFEMYKPQDVVKPKHKFIPRSVEFILSEIELIDPETQRVTLAKDKRVIPYDYLVIATGADIYPEETPGLKDGAWRQNIFDFYTADGATALAQHLKNWQGGRLVVNVVENPIKCPVAPLEFLLLADWYFAKRGMRNKVELVYATPLSGAFTKPVSAKALGDLLARRGIHMETDFYLAEVDTGSNKLVSYDEREVEYDLLVSVPLNMGAPVIKRSGMGDELNYVHTNKETLQSQKWENIWVLGDAANIPASKAGSVIHFQVEGAYKNILNHMQGKEMTHTFDGHSLCYIESGYGKAVMIDFSYDTEPLPGSYPFPLIGPFSLLKETRINHWGKLAFRPMYYELMLKGIDVPLPSKYSKLGKVTNK
ncbi:MAG: NAD(P)/FAD-dependent oxidoreductase [Anaerolineae bacterium]|nr:NAD(P)/FAD-dependent oxidoreductase [Anaerolineae bacterium]